MYIIFIKHVYIFILHTADQADILCLQNQRDSYCDLRFFFSVWKTLIHSLYFINALRDIEGTVGGVALFFKFLPCANLLYECYTVLESIN